MRPLCGGMRSDRCWLPRVALVSISSLVSIELWIRGAWLPNYSQNYNGARLGFGCPWSSRGNAAYESTRPCDSCKAPASMNAVSCERLVPLDVAADAVTPAYLPVTVADLHQTYPMRKSMAVPSIWWLAAPPAQKERNVSRLSSIPAARK